MYENIGKTCPHCQATITEENLMSVCPQTGVPHNQMQLEDKVLTQEANAVFCNQCGAALAQDQQFCHKCGAPVAAKKVICSNCGHELEEGQAFCPKCGQKAGAPQQSAVNPVEYTNPATSVPPVQKKKIPKVAIIAGVAVLAIILLVSGLGSKGPDFKALYKEYCNSIWADVGSDGSYLYIDTNPYDNDDDGLAYPSAYTAVKNVNRALGLPESVLSEMGETTGADGKQTETFEDLGVTVSWKYHPDKGLEVTYKKAK